MKKNAKYLILIIPCCYFSIGSILNYYKAKELETNGEFIITEIIDSKAGAYTTQHIEFKYVVGNEIKVGYQAYSRLIDNYYPKIGQKYLGKYLADKNGRDYIFLNIELANDLNIWQMVQKDYLIGKDTNISFIRL